MITATVKYNDNYTDIEFPCSEAYLSAKLMEIHVDDLSSTTRYISAITEPKELSFLKDKIQDSEYSEMQSAGNWYLKSYEWEIRELLEMEQSSPEDEMAQFFDDDESVKIKLVSAVWTVDEYKGKLYGKINCRFKEQLTEDETEIFKNWLVGQCADGFGEHFEQQPIQTEDGELFVSFWNSSDSYFLCTEDELESCIENSQGLQMGGM